MALSNITYLPTPGTNWCVKSGLRSARKLTSVKCGTHCWLGYPGKRTLDEISCQRSQDRTAWGGDLEYLVVSILLKPLVHRHRVGLQQKIHCLELSAKRFLPWSSGIIPNCYQNLHKIPREAFGQSARPSQTGTSGPVHCDGIRISFHNSLKAKRKHLNHVSRAQGVMMGGCQAGLVIRLLVPRRVRRSDGGLLNNHCIKTQNLYLGMETIISIKV